MDGGFSPSLGTRGTLTVGNTKWTVGYDIEHGLWQAYLKEYGDPPSMPSENARYYKRYAARPVIQSCLFSATNEYLRHLHGIALDAVDDKRWFEDHPLVGPDGVGQADTARVVQELVEPYGFYISAIRVKQGVTAFGDIAQWPFVLGCNPLGLTDHNTTNKDWHIATGDKTLFAFEYSNKPLRPAISCGSAVTSGDGHATYAGPRSKQVSLLDIQLSRTKKWLKEPSFPELIAKPEAQPVETLDLRESLAPDGTRMGGKIIYSYSFPGLSQKPSTNDKSALCYVCGFTISTKHHNVPHVCMLCYRALWRGFRCIKCNESLTTIPPTYAGIGKYKKTKLWFVQGRCVKCNELMALSEEGKDDKPRLIAQAVSGQWVGDRDLHAETTKAAPIAGGL